MTTIPPLETIEEALKKAPEIVDDFITSETLADSFEEIRTTHKLHLDEAEQLSRALNAVFLELAPADQFPDLLILSYRILSMICYCIQDKLGHNHICL